MSVVIAKDGLKSPPSELRWNFIPFTNSQVTSNRFIDPTPLAEGRKDVGKDVTELSFWDKFLELYGVKGFDDHQYRDCLRGVKKLSEINDPNERKKAFLENAAWLYVRSNEALDRARKNIEKGRDPWHGLNDPKIGLPCSSELHNLSDSYDQWEKLYHNILANFISHKVLNQMLIESSFDIDGTITDKNIFTVSTRTLQAMRQLHWLKRLMETSADDRHKIMEISINTARAEQYPYTSLDGPEQKRTYITHNSAIEEVAGYVLADQLDLLGKINIAMGNACIKVQKDDYTYISGNYLMVDRLINECLGKEFLSDLFNQTTKDIDVYTAEPKGMTDYILDHKIETGEVIYQHFKRIIQFYEEEVVNRKNEISYDEGLNNFRDKVLNDKEYGVLTGAEKWEKVYELENKVRDLGKTNATKSRIQEVKEELKQAKAIAFPHIRLLDSYIELLNTDPRAFFEKVTNGRSFGGCFHTYNSRGSPTEGAKEYALAKLRKYAYRTDVRKKIRSLKQEFYRDGKAKNVDVSNFVGEGYKVFYEAYQKAKDKGDKKAQIEAFKAYLNWRLCEHLMHNYQKKELEKCSLFECGNKVKLNSNLQNEWEKYWASKQKNSKVGEAYSYREWLESKLLSSNLEKETAKNLSSYLNDFNFNTNDRLLNNKPKIRIEKVVENEDGTLRLANEDEDSILAAVKEIEGKLVEDIEAQEMFFPDELFAWRGKRAYDGQTSLLAMYRFDEKSDALRKHGQFYYEILINDSKGDVISSFKDCFLNGKTCMHSGDSSSDVPAHAAALQREGMARVIYNLINIDDIYNEIIKQREKLVENIEKAFTFEDRQAALEELYYAYQRYGVYGLKKVGDKFYKVAVQKKDNGHFELKDAKTLKLNDCDTKPGSNEDKITLKDGDTLEWGILEGEFTEKEIFNEIENTYRLNIDRNLSPAQMLRKLAEVVQFLTGESIEYIEEELKVAAEVEKELSKGKSINEIDPQRRKIFEEYRWALTELRTYNQYTLDHPSFRVIREYTDESTDKVYYRFKSDGKLYTKDGEEFKGDEDSLTVKIIERDKKSGVFVYRETNKPFDFESPDFINKLYIEEEFLPSPTPVSGFFANKKLMKLFGGGNAERGARNLEGFLRKLPDRFSAFLEWAGGLMALGGVVRLLGHVVGGEVGKENGGVYKTGYWISQLARAFGCTGGALRGIINVNRNWDIAAGEIIQLFSALFLPNGAKHLGFGAGQLFLFTGRGIDAARRQQRVNAPTREEHKAKKLLKNIVDPREYVRKVIKFSQDGIVIPIKKSFEESGLSGVFGELVGRLTSALVTPIRFIVDIVKNPKLITQWKDRMSEKNGIFTKLCPSNGHLLGLVGILSGIGAVVGGTFGRMQRFGEIADHGFNAVGRWAITFSTAVAALGIYSNGREIAANPMGLPRIYRGLDGEDKTYNPNRAGKGQMLSSAGYAITPLFGLHNDWVAALYDIATGFYFGFPKSRMGVAEEETINSLNLAKSVLVEGQRYFKEREIGDLHIDDNYMERKARYVQQGDRWVYVPV